MGNKKKLKIMLYNLQDYDIPQFQRYRDQYDMKFLTTRLDENLLSAEALQEAL